MTSDNVRSRARQARESTSDNTRVSDAPRRGARPTELPAHLEAVHASYEVALRLAPVDEDTRRAYASRVRQFLAWLGAAPVDGDPLTDPVARDWAVRDYRSFLQSVVKRKPATVNTVLAALNDFYSRRGLGPADVRRLDVAQEAPRALDKEAIRWLRAVEGCRRSRDRALALVPFYGGLRIGEVVGLDLNDVRQSARRGLLVVRAAKATATGKCHFTPTFRQRSTPGSTTGKAGQERRGRRCS